MLECHYHDILAALTRGVCGATHLSLETLSQQSLQDLQHCPLAILYERTEFSLEFRSTYGAKPHSGASAHSECTQLETAYRMTGVADIQI